MSTSETAGNTLDHLLRKLFKTTQRRRSIPAVAVESEDYEILRMVCKRILSEDDWVKLVQTLEIRERWIVALRDQVGIEESVLKCAFSKLDFLATIQPENGAKRSIIDYVWFSDTLVDSATREGIKKLAALLENEPEHRNDTVPYMGAHLFKPIDSLLFPFKPSHSRVLAKPAPSPKDALSVFTLGHNPGIWQNWKTLLAENYGHADSSDKSNYTMHWNSGDCVRLPAEFSVDYNGGVTVDSYINNLHPIDYSDFYPTIASAFSCLLPLFEQTLTDIAHFQYSRDIPVKDNLPLRPVTPYSLRGRRLQVVVDMANIILDPDNSEYTGTKWYTGKDTLYDKDVVATGIYCYDSDNITDGGVELREFICGQGLQMFSSDDELDERIYDIISQEVGVADIKSGCCIVYSNVYQSRDTGFKLCDPTKSGYRKLLIFYLIDPSLRVLSSEIVPPQQQNWWARDIRQIAPIASLPDLIKDKIFDYIDYPMSLKRARSIRDEILSDCDHEIYEPMFHAWHEYEVYLCPFWH